MTATPLQWGLLSTARINAALIAPLRVSPRNQLLAVGSRAQATAETYAKKWAIPRAYGSYEALLADPDVDVIYNSLPNHLHAEWTIKALEAGKHVLCEKPFALTIAEVDAMEAAARKHQRVLAEAFMYRHHPQTLKVKELVDSGAIGKLQLIRGSFTFQMDSEEDVRMKLEMGGGSIWDVGCYLLSYARFIAGREPVEVFAWQVTGSKSGVDESFYGQMKFPGGVFAQFDSGFRTPYRTHIEIVGNEGSITVPIPFAPGKKETILVRRGAKTEKIKMPPQELYIGEVEDMADAILLGKAPRVSLADSRATVTAILALLESASHGQPVKM